MDTDENNIVETNTVVTKTVVTKTRTIVTVPALRKYSLAVIGT